MIYRTHSFVALCAVGLLLCASCSKAPEQSLPADAVAVVGTSVITQGDLELEAARRKAGGLSTLAPLDLLDRMMVREAMLQRAVRHELANDSEVRRELDRVLVSCLRERELAGLLEGADVSDDELEAAYEEQIDRFSKPALNRIAMLCVAKEKRMSDEKLAQLRVRADAAKEAADRLVVSGDWSASQGFGSLSVQYSDDVLGRYRGGDLGWISGQQAPPMIPSEVFARALELPLGRPSDVITLDSGFYLVMRTDERPASVTPFERVRSRLKKQLLDERREGIEQNYYDELLQAAGTQVFEESLVAVNIDVPGETDQPAPPKL